jgi:ubiquinone/menaquinone biosynthesis C-methylase UbiE
MRSAIVRQFHRPRGAGGHIVGWVMAHRASNRRRSAWAVAMLDVQPGERVLEVGFGPGLAVADLCRRVGESGAVYGIDHSDVMVHQASRRNASAIEAGRVVLVHASVDRLPPELDGPFDAILTVNSFGFWPAPVDRLAELRGLLAPGGRFAIVSQPRCPGATRDTSLKAARQTEDLLRAARYKPQRTELLDLDPPVACVLARNPLENEVTPGPPP